MTALITIPISHENFLSITVIWLYTCPLVYRGSSLTNPAGPYNPRVGKWASCGFRLFPDEQVPLGFPRSREIPLSLPRSREVPLRLPRNQDLPLLVRFLTRREGPLRVPTRMEVPLKLPPGLELPRRNRGVLEILRRMWRS